MKLPMLALALLLAPSAARVQDTPPPFEITQALLDDAIATARPAVELALGHPIPVGFRGARLAEVDEIEDVLAAENVPIMASQLNGDEKAARSQARAFAANLAPALFAKYAFESHEILISLDGFHKNAKLLDMPELLAEDVVRAILAHELVHAADIPLYGFVERCATLGNTDRIAAINAVLEGHAQHVAGIVCPGLGLAAGLATYNKAIIGAPKGEGDAGEALRLMRRVQREAVARTYVAGESFIAAVEAAEGQEGIARAFREPPRDMAEVQRPEWFLHPELRPKVSYDLEAALDAFEAAYVERGWKGVRQSVSGGDLKTAFESLEPDVVERMLAALKGARFSQRADLPKAQHYVIVYEWTSSEAAELFVRASVELLKVRDEQMKKGAVRVVAAEYEEVRLGEDGPTGVLARKTMKTLFEKVEVRTLEISSGPLTFEILRSGEVGTDAELLELAAKIVAAAEAPAPAPAPPKGDEPKEEPPADGTTGGAGG